MSISVERLSRGIFILIFIILFLFYLFIYLFQSVCLYYFIYLFIYLWLCWVFISVRGLSLVKASGGHSSSRCAGLSLSWPFLLRSTGSSRAGSVVVAHGPSCSAACGILPDQGSNPCTLHWQADSQPLRHQGRPFLIFLINLFTYFCLLWVFVAARGLSLVAASGGYSLLWCAGFSLQSPLPLRSSGSSAWASVVVARGLQ